MKKKVLITGASGFVGFHLIDRALHQGMDVVAAVRPSSNVNHLKGLPISFVNLRFSDTESLKGQLEDNQFNYIIHAAGLTKAKTEAEYNYINATLSRNLAEASCSAAIPLEKFVFISSLAALGPLPEGEPGEITPNSPARPVTAYGRSKLLAERYLRDFKSLPLVTLRPTAVYGPRERDIYIIIRSIARGLEPYIGSGAQKLSFVYVKDLAKATILALEEGRSGEAYNVSDGNVYSRYDLANITKNYLEKRTIKFHIPVPLVSFIARVMEGIFVFSKKAPALNKEKLNELNASNWACSISDLKRDLNYIPEFDLRRGLEETLDWYKDNRWI